MKMVDHTESSRTFEADIARSLGITIGVPDRAEVTEENAASGGEEVYRDVPENDALLRLCCGGA